MRIPVNKLKAILDSMPAPSEWPFRTEMTCAVIDGRGHFWTMYGVYDRLYFNKASDENGEFWEFVGAAHKAAPKIKFSPTA